MTEIAAILEALRPALATRHFRQLVLIIEATLSMTGRVTMLSIARWTEEGGSYRTVQRFFKQSHDWAKLRWLLIQADLKANTGKVFLLAGDEVVVTKAGKQTYGLGKFFYPAPIAQCRAYALSIST
jgi:putative transposase